jgi:CHAT domain-containing protein
VPLPSIECKLSCIAAEKAHDKNLPILYGASQELDYIREATKDANITLVEDREMSKHCTISKAVYALQSANLIHIICHGVQNMSDPLSSGFCLADGDLTVSRLAELNLKDAFFAFLSACETAKGDQDHPDQTVHLAATMLVVGFKSIVATMW